jgi:hypothetical protein
LIWFYPLLVLLFFFILLLPVEEQKTTEIPQITSSTRTDWGYTVHYCNQFYEQRTVSEERYDDGSGLKVIEYYKSYCSI